MDPEAVENLLSLLENYFIYDPNKTVLLVTHRVDFLTRCASKVVVLDNGGIIQEGSPYDILEKPLGETALIIQGIIDPSKSEWNLGYRCLESSVRISSSMLEQKGSQVSIFQKLADEVSNLIAQLEKNQPHLVLILTKEQPALEPCLLIRGVKQSGDFLLDGRRVNRLKELVSKETVISKGDGQIAYTLIPSEVFLKSYSKGIVFHTGQDLTGSLIALMFRTSTDDDKPRYIYASLYPPILGVYHTPVPITEERQVERMAYCEFSTGTRNVYLFSMEWDNDIVGVISIDTYSMHKWPPFVVKYIKLMANLGAIAIKTMGDAKDEDSLAG